MRLFCFGLGSVAWRLQMLVERDGGTVRGTRRGMETDAVFAWHAGHALSPRGRAALRTATHILVSVPPDAAGCPVARQIDALRPHRDALQWIGYFSTTSVYGDTQGGWVDETTALNPTSARAAHRVQAETQWRDWGRAHDVAAQVFRLSGIYGPASSPFDRIAAGDGRIIDAPGHVFNRIHIDDIAQTVRAGMHHMRDGVFNVSDDLPASQADVLRFAYELMELTSPDPVPLEQAGLSAMGREFYRDCKRVCNEAIKRELNVALLYPSYVEGLSAVYRDRLAGDKATQPD